MFTQTRSAGLLTRTIEGNFYAVNCFYPDSLRILTSLQYEVLSAIDGRLDLIGLARQFDIEEGALLNFLTSLSQKELISFGDAYSIPGKPKQISALNFWIHTTNKCNLLLHFDPAKHGRHAGSCSTATIKKVGGIR